MVQYYCYLVYHDPPGCGGVEGGLDGSSAAAPVALVTVVSPPSPEAPVDGRKEKVLGAAAVAVGSPGCCCCFGRPRVLGLFS